MRDERRVFANHRVRRVTQLIKVRMPDVDAAFARGREHGARVADELQTYEYGERSGVVEDLAGHRAPGVQVTRAGDRPDRVDRLTLISPCRQGEVIP